MDDEKLPTEQEENAPVEEAAAEQVEAETAAEAETVEDAAEHASAEVDEADDAVADEAADIDDRVETAVRNVAEEAQREAEEGAAGETLELDYAEPEDDRPAPKKRERRSKQARAAKGEAADAAAGASQKASGLASLGVPAWLGISAACLVLGLLLGRFVLGGSAAGANLAGKTTVSEAQLDDAYATYTYNGKSEAITIREVIEQNGTVDAAKGEDDTYTLPSAEYALNAARTAILDKEVESRGITVTEEDAAAYAESALGTSDYDSIASAYGMDADSVKELIMQNCRINALREDVIGSETPEMPAAPEAAEEGKEDEVTKEYADYIIGLAGDEWDEESGSWASEDGQYATALAEADFSADGASYNAAQTAYYVAYQLYTEQQNEMSTKWTEFLNGLMSNASIQVGTLVS